MHRPAGFAAKGQAIETVDGEIDFSAVPHLRERLLEQAASSRHVVTDLDQVSLASSTRPESTHSLARPTVPRCTAGQGAGNATNHDLADKPPGTGLTLVPVVRLLHDNARR
jgi:hypothetical protein